MKEIQALRKVLQQVHKPLVVVMGGAKIDDKVGTLNNLAKHADKIILGGAIAKYFLKALGYDLGKSQISDMKVAKQILRHYKEKLVCRSMPWSLTVKTAGQDWSKWIRFCRTKRYSTLDPKASPGFRL